MEDSQKSLRSALESWNQQKRGSTFLFMEVEVFWKKNQKDTKRIKVEEETFPI